MKGLTVSETSDNCIRVSLLLIMVFIEFNKPINNSKSPLKFNLSDIHLNEGTISLINCNFNSTVLLLHYKNYKQQLL